MTATLPARRLAEVQAKLASLDEELLHWQRLTQEENRGLRRHHSQVLRLATVFGALTQPVREAVGAAPVDPTLLDQVESWENQILAAHSIWEVFRSKLVLREDELFRDVLSACDDLLWACYGPAMAYFAPDRKAPPLVYFTSTWSPFAMFRDSGFQNEVRSGPALAGALADEQFLQVLRRLPIPLVSLPWYHVFHLPGALVLAHEAGHIVESDFELTADIESALQRADLENPDSWRGWASEVFADLYGCMMMGPPFAAAMMDLLSISARNVQNESRKTGRYPTRALRVGLMLEALRRCGHDKEVERLRSDWEGTYGAMRTMTEFKPDVPKVVSALCAGPYHGKDLTGIGLFPAGKEAEIQKIGEAAVGGFKRDLEAYDDPRLLFAGAQWIHENQGNGNSQKAYGRIVTQVIKRGTNQFRMRGEPVRAKADVDAGLALSKEADQKTGSELRQFLLEIEGQSGEGFAEP